MDFWVFAIENKNSPLSKNSYIYMYIYTHTRVNCFFEPVLKCEFVELLQFSKEVIPIYWISEVFLIFKSS